MRRNQLLLIVSVLLLSWLGMQIVHESGHVVAAWLSGGHVTGVVLHPLAISRTDLDVNPAPRFVTWCGPVVGTVLPVGAWGIAAWRRFPGHSLLRFFAGFCLVANGAYLGYGAVTPVGDAADLIRHGTPAWQLLAFGLITCIPGFALWNGLGPAFGLGTARDQVSRTTARLCLALLVVTVALELALSPS